MKSRLNSAGFSLLETLTVVALLAGLMIFLTFFSNLNHTRIDSTLHNSCKQLAQASLDNVRAMGFEKSVAPGMVETNQILFSAVSAQSIPPVVNSAHLAPEGGQVALMEQTGGTFTLNNYRTIIGSMAVLTSIYNSNPAFCTNPLGMAYPGGSTKLLADTADQNLRNVNSTIRIERYDIATGARDCPAGPIYFRPPGDVANDPALAGVVNRPANVLENHGLMVTVTTNYTDPSNLARNCQMSSIFQYPRVRTPAEVNPIAVNFTITPVAPAACMTGMPEGVLTVQAAENFDRVQGISILCRDRSSYQAVLSGVPAGPLCPGEAGATGSTVIPNDNWEDCSRVTACGLAPSNSAWNRTAGAPATLVNRYSNIPWGCVPTIEVRLIDPALNTTANPAVASSPPADSAFRQCLSCPVGWTGPGYCPPSTMNDGCVPPTTPPADGGGGGGGGGDGGGPADGGDGGGGGTDGADN